MRDEPAGKDSTTITLHTAKGVVFMAEVDDSPPKPTYVHVSQWGEKVRVFTINPGRLPELEYHEHQDPGYLLYTEIDG